MFLANYTGKNNLNNSAVKRMRYCMNTFFKIKACGKNFEEVKIIIEEVFKEAGRIERLLSRFSGGLTHRLNKQELSLREAPEELFEIIEECGKWREISHGAFDVRYGRGLLDFGAAGKGYAIDKIVNILKLSGIIDKAGLDFGGHLYYYSCDNEKEIIGIRDPLDPGEIIFSLPILNESVSTSANYERGGHLIDPRDGQPVKNSMLSVSVIHPSAWAADILSTAVFVLGEAKGAELVRNEPQAKAVIIINAKSKPKVTVINN